MARETTTQQREETTRQQAGQLSTKSADTASQSKGSANASRSTTAPSDQTDTERSIRTDRESGRSAGVLRQQPTSPIYVSPYRTPGSPFSMMRRMADDMDRLFENFGFGRTGLGLSPFLGRELDRDPWRQSSPLQQATWAPQVETFRRGDRIVVRADLPGMTKDDVKVEVDDGTLTISGERCDEHAENGNDFYRTERTYGQFYRAILLPEGVTGEECDASFKDGVLEVTLPAAKEPDRKAKRVQIR